MTIKEVVKMFDVIFESGVIGTITLIVVSCATTCFIYLSKTFNYIKKLDWKIMAGLFVGLKILDMLITHISLSKRQFYTGEHNVFFKLFHDTFEFSYSAALLIPNIILTYAIVYLFKKIFTKKRKWLVITVLVTNLMLYTTIHNCIYYFKLINLI